MKLYEIKNEYCEAMDALEALDIDPHVIEDSLAALKGELTDKVHAVSAFILNVDSDIDQLKAHKSKIDAMIKAKQKRNDWLRDYLRKNMEACDITKIEHPLFKVSIGKPSKVVQIDDDSKLPSDCIKTTVSPDKALIKKLLSSAELVPGASLVDGKARLTIK